MNKIKIGVSGAAGRMGRLIAQEVLRDAALELSAAIEVKGHESLGEKIGPVIITDNPETISLCRVFIEFTGPEATQKHLFICRDKSVGMVIGTTALDKKIEEEIKEASSKIPIVYSPNMSTGVNLLFRLTKEAANVLGKDFDIKITETHHRHKKDKPSGTAKRLAGIISEARGKELASSVIHSIREGEVAGEHTVVFTGEGEIIELTHRALSRKTFASGAVTAAKFIAKASPGLYTMSEVLFGGKQCL